MGWPIAMSMNAISNSLSEVDDSTAISTVESLRMLFVGLNQVEEPDGHWHKTSAAAIASLEKWDERQDGFTLVH